MIASRHRLLPPALLLVCVAGYLVIAFGSRPFPLLQPVANRDGGFSVQVNPQGVDYRLPALPYGFSWALTMANRPRYLDKIYVLTFDYQTGREPVSASAVYGLLANLDCDVTAIGWHPSTKAVTRAEMAERLQSLEPAVIVDPLGYWPMDVPQKALRNWIRAGGVFVWYGGRLGATVRNESGPRKARNPLDGTLWGRSLYEDDEGQEYDGTEVPLPPDQNLGLIYNSAKFGPSIARVSDLKGRALGWQSPVDDRVSLAVIPLGKGSVVVFGNGLVDRRPLDTQAAQDLVTILYRGLTDPRFLVQSGVSDGSAQALSFEQRRDVPNELAVIGSSDRWVNAYATGRP